MTDYKQILQQEIQDLKDKINSSPIPDNLKQKVAKDVVALERSVELGCYDEKYEKVSRYIDWVLRVPWEKESQDILDINHTKEIFEKHHFGMREIKERFLEYVSVLKLNKDQGNDTDFHAPVLLLVGLVGTGKTTFAYSLAEALGRQLVRIPFGGMSSSKDLRGQSRLFLESKPGAVVKGICQPGVRNPIILLDEIDPSPQEPRINITPASP